MHISFDTLFQQKNDKTTQRRAIQKKHPSFSYDSYAYELKDNSLGMTFVFTLHSNITCKPTLTIHNLDKTRFAKIGKDVLDNLVFHVGLIESMSYWKAAAPQHIQITCGYLTDEQKQWWKRLLVNGMGEYAYINSIDVAYLESVGITCDNVSSDARTFTDSLTPGALQPIGGGKDSAVTAQILWEAGTRTNALLLNPTPAAKAVSTIAGMQNPIIVTRQIDPLLLELNAKGYINGHTPFSAYLGFLSVFCAVLFDYSDCVLSNERSANQGNVNYQGNVINHQYSKSFDFEKQFSEYVKTYLASQVSYFSFLRPFYELQIAKIFSTFDTYHEIFRSCNVGQKSNSWCGNCAKCLFVYVTLYPFLGKETLVSIFGQDLFAKDSLLPIAKDLLGETKQKPFDCVGTYEEVRAAFYLSLKDVTQDQVLLHYFKTEILSKYHDIQKQSQIILKSWDDQNLLTDTYKNILRHYVQG